MLQKISANDFSTNRKMLNKNVLRYVENYANYLQHIVTYFGEPLNLQELRWLQFIMQRLELFVKDAPKSESVQKFVGRYQRVLTKLKKIQNENMEKNISSDSFMQPSSN